MNMEGVGQQLVDALRTEDTTGQPDRYALCRLASMLDQLAEIPQANTLIAQQRNRLAQTIEQRRRMMAVGE